MLPPRRWLMPQPEQMRPARPRLHRNKPSEFAEGRALPGWPHPPFAFLQTGYLAQMRLTPILTVLLLTACSSGDEGRTAGGVSQAEAAALDDAAQMLDQQRLPASAAPAAQPVPVAKPDPAKPAG